MKKKLIVPIFLVCVVVFIILCFKCIKIEKIDVNNPSSGSKTMATEEILVQVLNGTREFINSDGVELLINNLVIEDTNCKVNSYAFVDIDGDKNNELIAVTDSYYGYYLVLHIDSNIIYGYYVSSSDIDYINNEGIILDKANDSRYYRRLIFDKTSYKKSNLASYSDSEYTINNTVVSSNEFKSYEDEYALKGLLKFRNYNSNWMDKKINGDYGVKIISSYTASSEDSDFLFGLDKKFDNFKNDLREDKINLYYIDSNRNSGKIILKRIDDDIERFSEEINTKKSMALYDEDSDYIAVVNSADRLDSDVDNFYEVYYFKYYNKGMQYLGKKTLVNYTNIFDEDMINSL